MTRWILAVVALVATGAAFKITSPGWLALALFVALICAIGAFLGFASARVDEVSQGQSSRELELLLTSRKGGAAPPARPAPGARPAAPAAPRARRDTGGNESFLYASAAGAGAAHTHDDTPGDAGGGDAGGGGGGSD
jgi:hypothetical protein